MTRFLLALLLLAPAAAAQDGQDALRYGSRFPAVGARLSAMAGAAAAGVGDWEAIYANPAGLGLAGASAVTGSFGGGWAESEATFFGERADTRISGYDLGTLAYVAKLPTRRGSLVVGLGYSRTADFDRDLVFSGQNPDFGVRQDGSVFESGGAGTFSAAAAVEAAPGVMVGLSLNAVSGTYDFVAATTDEDAAACPDFGCSYRDDILGAELRGGYLRAGVSSALGGGFRAGLALETPTLLRVEEQVDLQSTFFDPFIGDFGYTIQTPWRFAGGVAYDQGGLLLSADVELADWSQAVLRPRADFVVDGEDRNATIRRDFRESVTSRFGAEYDFGMGVVRAGMAFETDPLRDLLERDGFTESRAREHYTTGVGFRAGRAMLNVAFVHTQFQDRTTAYPFELEDGEGNVFLPPVVDEAFSRTRVLFGVTVEL